VKFTVVDFLQRDGDFAVDESNFRAGESALALFS